MFAWICFRWLWLTYFTMVNHSGGYVLFFVGILSKSNCFLLMNQKNPGKIFLFKNKATKRPFFYHWGNMHICFPQPLPNGSWGDSQVVSWLRPQLTQCASDQLGPSAELQRSCHPAMPCLRCSRGIHGLPGRLVTMFIYSRWCQCWMWFGFKNRKGFKNDMSRDA